MNLDFANPIRTFTSSTHTHSRTTAFSRSLQMTPATFTEQLTQHCSKRAFGRPSRSCSLNPSDTCPEKPHPITHKKPPTTFHLLSSSRYRCVDNIPMYLALVSLYTFQYIAHTLHCLMRSSRSPPRYHPIRCLLAHTKILKRPRVYNDKVLNSSKIFTD